MPWFRRGRFLWGIWGRRIAILCQPRRTPLIRVVQAIRRLAQTPPAASSTHAIPATATLHGHPAGR